MYSSLRKQLKRHCTKRRDVLTLCITLLFSNLLLAQQVAQVSTFAGNKLAVSQDGTGTQAGIRYPLAICRSASDDLYVLEGNGTIKKITSSGVVTTVYTNSLAAFTTEDQYSKKCVIHIDNQSNLYFSRRSAVYKVTGPNSVQLIAGKFSEPGNIDNNITGRGADARFQSISGISSDLFGNLYVASTPLFEVTSTSSIKQIVPSTQKVSTLFTTTKRINGLCFDNSANFVFGEGNAIVKWNRFTNTKTVIAGDLNTEGNMDGNGSQARFGYISDIRINSNNEIFVLEGENELRSFVSSAESILSGIGYQPRTVDDRTKFITVLKKIDVSNNVTTIAGGYLGFRNAVGKNAQFNLPWAMTINSSGQLFVADNYNNLIRKVEFVAPTPPTPTYINATPSICLGSTVNQQPTISGSETHLQANTDSITIADGISATAASSNFVYIVTSTDSIKKYDINDTIVATFPPPLSNISAIAADPNERLYVVANDNTFPALTSVYRLLPNGFIDFSWGPTTSGLLNNVSALTLGSDGLLYVADTTTGYISTIDTATANVTNLPPPSNLQFSYVKPIGIATDVYGDLYLLDKDLKQVLKRNKADNNYYSYFPGLETTTFAFDGIAIDRGSTGSMILSSSTQNKVLQLEYGAVLDTSSTSPIFTNSMDLAEFMGINLNAPLTPTIATSNNAMVAVFPCVGDNKLRLFSLYAIKIAPQLPAGLFLEPIKGTIYGNPMVTAPYTTYTITTYGVADSTITYKSFSVDPSSLVSNNIGNKTSEIINTRDGLSVNFYAESGCEPLAKISDNTDGNPTGNVQVSQTVSTNLPYFTTSAGNTQFVRRTTDVNAQEMDSANVRIELYFTHADIVHYNANNGTQTDFSNDTTAGTMNMSILQLHTSASGNTQTITHNTTATWNTAKQVWVANFPVTKFSTFMATTQDALSTFDCASAEYTDFAFGCTSADYNGITYSANGEYTLEYQNQYGCDSIVHLYVILDNNVEINMVGSDTLKAINTDSGTTYQWVNCDNNYAFVPGATDSIFHAIDTGSYACIITNSVCTDTSGCAYIQQLGGFNGIDENGNIVSYTIAPNPSTGVFHVYSNQNSLTIEIYNSLGEMILSKSAPDGIGSVDLTEHDSGMYLVKLTTKTGGIYTERIIKQ